MRNGVLAYASRTEATHEQTKHARNHVYWWNDVRGGNWQTPNIAGFDYVSVRGLVIRKCYQYIGAFSGAKCVLSQLLTCLWVSGVQVSE